MLLPDFKYGVELAYEKESVWYCICISVENTVNKVTNLQCNCFPLFSGKESEQGMRKQQQSNLP
jgi:hypothetical protein